MLATVRAAKQSSITLSMALKQQCTGRPEIVGAFFRSAFIVASYLSLLIFALAGKVGSLKSPVVAGGVDAKVD